MPKRFTDTGKWKDSWFQDLPTKYKLFWIYLLDECDHAGIWKPNIRLAVFQIGEPFEESELKMILAQRITVTEDGYWFINKFIEFQYGELSESSKPHQSVLKTLNIHKIKGYAKGIDTLKDKEKDKDKDKDKIPALEEFLEYCKTFVNLQDYEFPLKSKYEAWVQAGWKDGNGEKIKNWKTKIKNTVPYLKPYKPEKPAEKTTDTPKSLKERHLSPILRNSIKLSEYVSEFNKQPEIALRIDLGYINEFYKQGSDEWKRAVIIKYLEL